MSPNSLQRTGTSQHGLQMNIVTRKSEEAQIKRAKAEAKNRLAELTRLSTTASTILASTLPSRIISYFDCQASKHWAALRAIHDLGLQRIGCASDIAAQINVHQPCSETIVLTPGNKRSDGSRQPLLEFGPVNTARQLLALDVAQPSPFQNFNIALSARVTTAPSNLP
jgi:hypothetical protein